jgi:hypothetical protein
MSDEKLQDMATLETSFAEQEAVEQFVRQQHVVIESLRKELARVKEERDHLKSLLSASTPLLSNSTVQIEVSPEQAICEIQIKMLRDRASDRELTLEETKRLEILVKSLVLIKEKTNAAIPVEFSHVPAGVSLDSLAQLAASPDPQPEAD